MRTRKPLTEAGKARQRAYNKKLYADPEYRKHKLARQRADYIASRARRLISSRESRQRQDPERQRQWKYKRLLNGATLPRERPQHCELCGGQDCGKVLHFDHDHITGAFRGWLCSTCNMALGLMQDNPLLLERAADYIRFSGPTNVSRQG